MKKLIVTLFLIQALPAMAEACFVRPVPVKVKDTSYETYKVLVAHDSITIDGTKYYYDHDNNNWCSIHPRPRPNKPAKQCGIQNHGQIASGTVSFDGYLGGVSFDNKNKSMSLTSLTRLPHKIKSKHPGVEESNIIEDPNDPILTFRDLSDDRVSEIEIKLTKGNKVLSNGTVRQVRGTRGMPPKDFKEQDPIDLLSKPAFVASCSGIEDSSKKPEAAVKDSRK